jgi:hypothetical protein
MVLVSGLVLGLFEIAIIAIALIIGVSFLYVGFKTYSKSQ